MSVEQKKKDAKTHRSKKNFDELCIAIQEGAEGLPGNKVKESVLIKAVDLAVSAMYMPGKVCMAKTARKGAQYPKVSLFSASGFGRFGPPPFTFAHRRIESCG